MKRILTFILIFAVLIAGVWLWRQKKTTVSKPLFAMGTVFEITASGSNPGQAIANAFKEIKRIESLTSNRDNSDLQKVNRNAGVKPVKVGPELLKIFKKVAEFYSGLSGAFDPTVGPLIDLWGFNPEAEPRLPNQDQINRCLALIGFDRVIINFKEQTVFLPVKGMKLDLGGIAKGYAVDRAYLSLHESGINTALINGGSSSIRVIGKRTGRNHWRLGIGHPRRSGELLGALSLPGDGALGTSADNQHFFIHNGVRYPHLLDPRTGYPARDKILVTVTAPTAMEADLLSTAFFVLPVPQVQAFISANPQYGAIVFDSSGRLMELGETTFQTD